MPPNSKRIVITGASGFIGKACVEYLKLNGHEVLRAGRSQTDEIFCDLSEPKSCLALGQVSDIDAIIHLGAHIGWDGSSLEQMYAPNILSSAIFSNIAYSKNALLVFSSAAIIAGAHSEIITDQSAEINVNAKTGSNIIPANETEIIVKNKHIAHDKQIVIVATSPTENQIVHLTAKKENDWFKVGIDQPIENDIKFDWWIVD